MTRLDQFQQAATFAKNAIDRLAKYEDLLKQAVDLQGTIFICDKCGEYAVRLHQGRKLCGGCRR